MGEYPFSVKECDKSIRGSMFSNVDWRFAYAEGFA